MDDTPPALAVGQRVMNHGYSSIWIKGKRPCWILPHEGVAVLSVKRTCPFYIKETEVYSYDDERLPDLCGIRIRLGDEQATACPLLCFVMPAAHATSGSAEPGLPSQEGGASSSAGPGAAEHSTGSGAPTPLVEVTPLVETDKEDEERHNGGEEPAGCKVGDEEPEPD